METIRRIALWIWFNPFIRELLLFLAASLGATLALQLLTLQGTLDGAQTLPLNDLKTWFVATVNALGMTAIKQLIVFVLVRVGRIHTKTTAPPP